MWLFIVIVVLTVLLIGGIIARNQQLKRSRPAFERSLTQADHALAAASAADRGWDRKRLEAAARRAYSEQYGGEPEAITLVEVIDKPGTEEDQAIFEAGGRRVDLGRRGGDWEPSAH